VAKATTLVTCPLGKGLPHEVRPIMGLSTSSVMAVARAQIWPPMRPRHTAAAEYTPAPGPRPSRLPASARPPDQHGQQQGMPAQAGAHRVDVSRIWRTGHLLVAATIGWSRSWPGFRTRILIVPMGVRRPDWWCYPERRANGHDWAPGQIVVSWMPCECRPAAAAREHGPGHLVIYCQAPGCRSVAARQAIGAAQPSLPASCFQQMGDLIIPGCDHRHDGSRGARRCGTATVQAQVCQPGYAAGTLTCNLDDHDHHHDRLHPRHLP
jgi:hypothetical protein